MGAVAQNMSRRSFNDSWLFALTDSDAPAAADFNDNGWRQLSLPHDWAIEGDFSVDNPSGAGGGALPGGVGWYRKHFDYSPRADRKVYFDVDGAYMNASVYVNGHYLGTRPYGYASFSYDITPYLKNGQNVIAVKVDNAEQPNSRWYSGCGIYRNTWLREQSLLHIPLWGVHVVPSENNLKVSIKIDNDGERKAIAQLRTVLTDRKGQTVASAFLPIVVKKGQSDEFTLDMKVSDTEKWSVDNPYLYTLTAEIVQDNKVIDTYQTKTGFRTIDFDAVKGFSLNGKRMKINGVCLHHDAGALGAAVNRRAIERQLQILKEMGVNAIRSSHNPPAPELLELCDSLGLMVMDETFDMWRKKKTEHDYARYFNEWHERDLTDLFVRDRNHPSIIMWSIGNEVLEQWSDANADTLSLEQANMILNFGHSKDMLAAEGAEMSVNSLLTRKLAEMGKSLDPTRPITAGCNEPDPGNHLFRSGALDIIGFNYHDDWFKDVPKNFPGKPFIITESVSALMTRGYYRMPSDSVTICPLRWDIPYEDPSFACSSYDNCHVPWGNTHEGTMRHVENNDFIMGQFIWTGFDYIGEPTPYNFPARSSYFGIVDLAGIPKDIYYMYQSRWRPDLNVLHLFPHWNWQEGQTVDMWAYYNNADEVELFVNGESQGIQTPNDSILHASWRVKFVPGTVEAVSRKNGKEVARASVKTAGEASQIRLTPDRREITADGRDLSYVLVEVLDDNGVLCPWAENDIKFEVTGSGRNVGVDNGSPISMERFKDDHRKAFYGKAMLIVQNDGTPGQINVKATSDGLKSSETKSTAK